MLCQVSPDLSHSLLHVCNEGSQCAFAAEVKWQHDVLLYDVGYAQNTDPATDVVGNRDENFTMHMFQTRRHV
jgi:hypothetical protein